MNKKESNILNIMQCIAVLLVVAGHSIETLHHRVYFGNMFISLFTLFICPYLCCLVVICFFIVDIAIF